MPVSPIRSLLPAVLILCALGCGFAQTTTSGALAGVFTDPSGAVVTEAIVQIKDQAKGKDQLARTDSNGVYHFFFLLPGEYVLNVTRPGFREKNGPSLFNWGRQFL